ARGPRAARAPSRGRPQRRRGGRGAREAAGRRTHGAVTRAGEAAPLADGDRGMSAASRTDDALLDLLALALAPLPVEPAPVEIAALQMALERPEAPLPMRRLRRPLPARVAALVLVVLGAVVALRTATLPDPVRTVVRAAGLPVDSPALAATKRSI